MTAGRAGRDAALDTALQLCDLICDLSLVGFSVNCESIVTSGDLTHVQIDPGRASPRCNIPNALSEPQSPGPTTRWIHRPFIFISPVKWRDRSSLPRAVRSPSRVNTPSAAAAEATEDTPEATDVCRPLDELLVQRAQTCGLLVERSYSKRISEPKRNSVLSSHKLETCSELVILTVLG